MIQECSFNEQLMFSRLLHSLISFLIWKQVKNARRV